MAKTPHIAISSVIKNRLWCLPYFLGCILNLDYPKKDTSLIFVDDASTDGTREMLGAFALQYADSYRNIIIRDGGDDIGDDATSARNTKDRPAGYPHLAGLRNMALDLALEVKATYQLSIDSDILAAPGLLTGLLADNLPYVSSIIFNDVQGDKGHIALGVPITGRYSNAGYVQNEKINVFKGYKFNQIYPCGYSGAVYLIDSAVMRSPARFSANKHGEDIAYCLDVQAAGFKCHMDSTLRTVHLMVPECLNEGIGVYYAWFGAMPGKFEVSHADEHTD